MEGLTSVDIDKKLVLYLLDEGLSFSTKHTIPISRVIGIDVHERSVSVKGSPIGSALGVGLIAMIVGGFILGQATDSEIPAIIFGIVGCIVGAIKGLQPVVRKRTYLKLFYKSTDGMVSDITLMAVNKVNAVSFVEEVNQKVRYMPNGYRENKSFEL